MLIVSTTLTTGFFTIYALLVLIGQMGLKQPQKYIQVTKSWYHTGVQYHIPMG